MRLAFSIYKKDGLDYSGGFEQLLRQEKTLYVVSDKKEDLPVTLFEKVFPDWAYQYVEEGNIAIVSGANKNTFNFDSGFLAKASIEYIDLKDFNQAKARISSSISVFAGEGKGEYTLHENRTIKDNLYPGFYKVFIYKKYGKGTIIYSGINLAEILTYEGSDLRRTSDVLDYDERICSVDKAKIKFALRDILREAMNKAGYPYLSLSYYPHGAKNVFAYSIDGDGLLSEGLNNLLEVTEETGTRMVFYINKQLCEKDPKLKEKLSRIAKSNIIASHGAIHNGKDSYEDNINDLNIFEEWMNELGIPFERSYAAPRGMYCQSLGKALKDKEYRHSRDFGYVIDDLPYYPYSEGEQETVLQIPCDGFNVCRLMGIRKENGEDNPSKEEVVEYYKKEIDLKLSRNEPLLFFCHPQYFGLYAKEVYPRIIDYVKEKDVMLTDYISYGDYWIERDKLIYDAEYKDGLLSIEKIKWNDDVCLYIDGKLYKE